GVITPFTDYVSFPGPRETILEDLDNDGDLDLAYATGADHRVVVRMNNGLGSFGAGVAYEVETTGNLNRLLAFDMDDDGTRDLVTTMSQIPTVAILYNYGDGSFDSVDATGLSSANALGGLTIDDYDLDGLGDVAIARNAPMLRLYYGADDQM